MKTKKVLCDLVHCCEKHYAKGYCKKHYVKMKRRKKKPPRFFIHFTKEEIEKNKFLETMETLLNKDYVHCIKTKLITALGEREIMILAIRFGFEGSPKTLQKCGEILGTNRERIRQIEACALKKIRHHLYRLMEETEALYF